MDKLAQQAAQAARRMARLAFVRQKRDEAVLRAIVGQLRIQHIEPDYPIDLICCVGTVPRTRGAFSDHRFPTSPKLCGCNESAPPP